MTTEETFQLNSPPGRSAQVMKNLTGHWNKSLSNGIKQ